MHRRKSKVGELDRCEDLLLVGVECEEDVLDNEHETLSDGQLQMNELKLETS